MIELFFHIPTRVFFGKDVLSHIDLSDIPCGERAILITEGVLNEWKIIDRVKESLRLSGLHCIVFDEIDTESTSMQVEKAVRLARASHTDTVVGLGGVHALSIARFIARMTTSSGDLYSVLNRGGYSESRDPLPCIEIPTTCRDPFLLTDRCIIADARNRAARFIKTGNPSTAAFIDPIIMTTLSANYTAATMFDALLLAVEGVVSAGSSFLSDALFLRASEILGGNIENAYSNPSDPEAQQLAAQAGLLISAGMVSASPGAGYGIAHAISGRFLVPQSFVSTIMLPHILNRAMHNLGEKISPLLTVLINTFPGMGDITTINTTEGEGSIPEALRHLIASFNLPVRLSDLELKQNELLSITGSVMEMKELMQASGGISSDDIALLIRNAF